MSAELGRSIAALDTVNRADFTDDAERSEAEKALQEFESVLYGVPVDERVVLLRRLASYFGDRDGAGWFHVMALNQLVVAGNWAEVGSQLRRLDATYGG